MGCKKVGRYPSERAALDRVATIWEEIRAGVREFRDHTPHAAVWCYSHNTWHLTSNGIKPHSRGKGGKLANGLRTNDRRARRRK